MVITLFVFSDMLDGAVARVTGRTGVWGAFLDSTLDRFGDAAIFGGIALFYAGRGHNLLLCCVALACLVFASLTSYVKARAEGLGLTCDVGFAERSERLVIILVVHRVLRPVRRRTGSGSPHCGSSRSPPPFTVGQRLVEVRKQAMAAIASVKQRLVLVGLPAGLVRTALGARAGRPGRCSTLIADVGWWRRGKGVRRLEANLARVVGPGAVSGSCPAQGMRSYFRYWYEIFRLPVLIAVDDLDGALRACIGLEQPRGGARAEGRGAILALPHMGNWDQAGAWLVGHGHPVHDRRRAAGAGRAVRPVRRLPRVARDGGAAADRWRAVAPTPCCASGCAPGGVICLLADRDLTERGVEVDVLRRDRPDAGRARGARAGHRCRAAAGDADVPEPSATVGTASSTPRWSRRRRAPAATRWSALTQATGRRLRRGHRRGAAGLAHAAAVVGRRPRRCAAAADEGAA